MEEDYIDTVKSMYTVKTIPIKTITHGGSQGKALHHDLGIVEIEGDCLDTNYSFLSNGRKEAKENMIFAPKAQEVARWRKGDKDKLSWGRGFQLNPMQQALQDTYDALNQFSEQIREEVDTEIISELAKAVTD